MYTHRLIFGNFGFIKDNSVRTLLDRLSLTKKQPFFFLFFFFIFFSSHIFKTKLKAVFHA